MIDLVRIASDQTRARHPVPGAVAPTAEAVADALARSDADAILCLDAGFPMPDADLLDRLLDGPCDAWHAGLRLGLGGQRRALDHVQPQWMLTTPSPDDREITSPLVSLRALLVRRTVVDQLGGPEPSMDTLAGAGIELGIRWTKAGALVRHAPELAPASATPCRAPSPADDLRTVARHFGRMWSGWALARDVAQGAVPVGRALGLARCVRTAEAPPREHYVPPPAKGGDTTTPVSVVVPTIDRYSYLEELLRQLEAQTVAPSEVIVVDQTAPSRRRHDLEGVAPRLPLRIIHQERPGQSTARNAALRLATGDAVLFLDDDEDVEPDLIQLHLERLRVGIDALVGGVDDATAGPPPPGFRHRQASSVFPTGNSMVRRSALVRSGLFDPTFDHGPRADRDLGIRLHLSGAVMVYDPSVMVFHHHAPVGGLRTHGARAVTRASARRSLTSRNLPSVTEAYVGLRYYSRRQRREARAVRILSVLSGGGTPSRRLARASIQLALLPSTVARIRRTERRAHALLAVRPEIPRLEVAGPDEVA